MCETLRKLYQIILDRIEKKPPNSYTVYLVEKGKNYIARKVGEEAIELILASLTEDRRRVVEELADLVYHMLVLMAVNNITLDDLCLELERRMRK